MASMVIACVIFSAMGRPEQLGDVPDVRDRDSDFADLALLIPRVGLAICVGRSKAIDRPVWPWRDSSGRGRSKPSPRSAPSRSA